MEYAVKRTHKHSHNDKSMQNLIEPLGCGIGESSCDCGRCTETHNTSDIVPEMSDHILQIDTSLPLPLQLVPASGLCHRTEWLCPEVGSQ